MATELQDTFTQYNWSRFRINLSRLQRAEAKNYCMLFLLLQFVEIKFLRAIKLKKQSPKLWLKCDKNCYQKCLSGVIMKVKSYNFH